MGLPMEGLGGQHFSYHLAADKGKTQESRIRSYFHSILTCLISYVIVFHLMIGGLMIFINIRLVTLLYRFGDIFYFFWGNIMFECFRDLDSLRIFL